MKDAEVGFPKKVGWFMCQFENGSMVPSPFVSNMRGEKSWLVEMYGIKVVSWRELTVTESNKLAIGNLIK